MTVPLPSQETKSVQLVEAEDNTIFTPIWHDCVLTRTYFKDRACEGSMTVAMKKSVKKMEAFPVKKRFIV